MQTAMIQQMRYTEELAKLLITNPARDLKKAAQIYAKLMDQDPAILEEIKQAVKFRQWGRLEAVARGALDPRLVFAYSIGAQCLRAMPLKVQKGVLDNGLQLFLGPNEYLNAQADNLSREQAHQVFDVKGMCVRDEAGQRSHMEHVKSQRSRKPKKAKPDYEIHRGKIRILKFMTPSEILKIIAEM